MADTPPSPARLTTTVYSYLEQLVAEVSPECVSRLGLRWSFGFSRGGLDALTEYSLPLNPTPFLDVLDRRGGIHLERHIGDTAGSLYEHISGGAPAIVAIDAYYLPFRPAYGRVHSSRAVLVREGGTSDEVLVQDGWAPTAEGVIRRRDLDRARYSTVPFNQEREPLFAGTPLCGEWMTVRADRPATGSQDAWTASMLGTLYREMKEPVNDGESMFGSSALEEFRCWLDGALDDRREFDDTLSVRRAGSLLLRVELSSRLYFCAFLRRSARTLKDWILRYESESYRRSLGHMQNALDVMIKTLRRRRPEYDEHVRFHLRQACITEERLAHTLSAYADRG